MIRHIVMLNLEPGHNAKDLGDVMQGLADLQPQIDGFVAFEHGINRDFERKSQEYPYGFICTFNDAAALSAYADDATHKALGARLVAMCRGGAAGIMVMDLDV